VAPVPEPIWLVLLAVAGAAGVSFYGYSSRRIGERFGMVSAPYAAVYAALLMSVLLFSTAPSFDQPLAVLMALLSWILFSVTILRARVIKHSLTFQLGAVAIGFLALVLFPLFTGPVLRDVFAALYRAAALIGWVIGAKPGIERKKGG